MRFDRIRASLALVGVGVIVYHTVSMHAGMRHELYESRLELKRITAELRNGTSEARRVADEMHRLWELPSRSDRPSPRVDRPPPTGAGNPPPAHPRTAGEYFKTIAESVITPHGKVRPGSVADGTNNTVYYTTADGSRWIVTGYKMTDGTYRYADPERTKPVPTDVPPR